MGDATSNEEQPSLEPPQLFGRRKKKRAKDAPETDEGQQTVPAPATTPPPPEAAPVATEAETVRIPEQTAAASTPADPTPTTPTPVAGTAATTTKSSPPPRTARTQQAADSPVFTEEEPQPSVAGKVRAVGGSIAGGLTSRFRSIPARAPSNGLITSAVTGLVVGLVMVGLTAAAFKGCESVRNTSTCGGGPGFVLLVLILVAGVLTGRVLLTAFKVPDPGSTSFLAVGLIAVAVLLFFIDVAMSWPMIIIVPVLGTVTFMASYWLTTTFVEPAKL